MISRNSLRFKFISLLMVMTMVFSMAVPMGAWANGSVLEHNVSNNAHTFAQLEEGYKSGDITELSVSITVTTGSQANVTAIFDGGNSNSFEFNSGTTTASMGEVTTSSQASFTVKPKMDLAEGTYTTKVKVTSDEDNTGISFDITQVVAKAAPAKYTLSLTGEGLTTTPAAGSITVGTEITATVAPPQGKKVATFTVGGVDKKAELLAAPVNQYTFNMPSENTEVVVTYADMTNKVVDISTPNVLLVGEYAFTLDSNNDQYNLNNFIKAAQTSYEYPSGTYHIYLHAGNGIWYDLVTDSQLKNPIQDVSKINGNGTYSYMNMISIL